MGNYLTTYNYNSYHWTDACSARNITWHYINSNGSLPTLYTECPYTNAILRSHCCKDGLCRPSWIDIEFRRYRYANYDAREISNDTRPWDGLGYPANQRATPWAVWCWPIPYETKKERKTRLTGNKT